MATYPSIRLKISKFITPTQLQSKLLDIIDNDRVRRGVNQIIAERVNKYVPMKTGALRSSMHVGPKTISWGQGLDYARYQYGGIVYGPNFPGIENGNPGWRSYRKYPTNRELGIPGIAILHPVWELVGGEYVHPTVSSMVYTFGYTTPGTHHHWIDEMLQKERIGMQVQITSYLKKEARKISK